ncbi:IclR family transcriptional regulator [Paraburkholderia sp. BCC1885]|uniref:IclR family transcriptional regulator n=1 Tax=Paraburkholderia sp. BCC1885 TaxID=2562669 RepID=UPI001184422A|nr:IclR family transcriptional regulator [Paraburkholderia sp. BCC1885]
MSNELLYLNMARPKLQRTVPAGVATESEAADEELEAGTSTALARGLAVLRAFRQGEVYLGNAELAERTGIPNSTISRLTFTLQKLGYLHYIPSFGRYQLGSSVLDLGYGFLSNIRAIAAVRPLMTRLAAESGGVVSLAALDGQDMIYLEVARGVAAMTRNISVGLKIPVARTSIGWCCLWGMDKDERLRTMDALEAANSPAWPDLNRRIKRAWRQVDKDGFCINISEYATSINAVSVPFLTRMKRYHFAINCTAPSAILSKDALVDRWGPALRRMAELAEQQIYPLEGIAQESA